MDVNLLILVLERQSKKKKFVLQTDVNILT